MRVLVTCVIVVMCNTACSYFQNIVNLFESKMQLYRRQIEELESHLLAISPESGMSSQSEYHKEGQTRGWARKGQSREGTDLVLKFPFISSAIVEILRLQYKPFLLLAAQLQTTHEQVQNLKEQYLSYRKVFLHSSVDVFEERRKENKPGELVGL